MEKHKLFKSPESSLQFDSSSDDRECFRNNIPKNPKMTSNKGIINTSTPLRRSTRLSQMQTSVIEEGAAAESTSNINKQSTAEVNKQRTAEDNKQSTAKVNKQSTSKVDQKSAAKVDKESPAEVDKHNIATQANILPPLTSIYESDTELRSGSDSTDSMQVTGFFSRSSQKLPYSYEEDEEIIKYILKGQNIYKVTAILIWRHLAQKKANPKRTYQSLKNRFLRNIKPKLFTTYRHLIPDEETVQKILTKFPDLKKDVGRKETLVKIKLPQRIPASKMPFSTPVPEDETDSESFGTEKINISGHMTMPSTSRSNGNELNFYRKVEINNESLSITVNLKFEHPRPKSTRIYEKYLNLKLKNKLSRCSVCGRGGGPDLRPDSGAESDTFISNSVESRRSESPQKKKLFLWKTKSFQSPKRKKNNIVSDLCNDQRSCSPSLLNDVNEVDELGEGPTKDAENQRENVQSVECSNSDSSMREKDSALEEPEVASRDTDSIYQNTVAEFRKLIDSDEEEMLVNKCLRKNSKTIGFNPNMSVDEVHVDSYFIRSSSPCLQSATVSDSQTESAKSRMTTRSTSGASLAKNMMNMLAKTNRI